MVTVSADAQMRRSVLYVVTGLGWGGAESQVIDLAARFRSRGWQVHVVTLLADAERRESLETIGIPVTTLGMKRGWPDPRAVWRLVRLIRKLRPTVVHAHMVHSNIMTRVARPFAPVPVLISNAHNTNEGARWRMAAYRITDSLTDVTTNVSEAAVERSIERGSAPASRIRVMPNGVDFHRFRRDEEERAATREKLRLGGRFTWLTVGSFEDQKDYPNLLNGLGSAISHDREPLLLAVGDGPRRAGIEAAAARADLSDSVRFLGLRKDVNALMNAADAFVMSSAWEGLPMALLEAAASELPIVATDVGGNAQIVQQGETGILVPARDGGALGAAMTRVMALSPEERRLMGARGAAHVRETFGLESVVDRWEAMYHELYELRGDRQAGMPNE